MRIAIMVLYALFQCSTLHAENKLPAASLGYECGRTNQRDCKPPRLLPLGAISSVPYQENAQRYPVQIFTQPGWWWHLLGATRMPMPLQSMWIKPEIDFGNRGFMLSMGGVKF